MSFTKNTYLNPAVCSFQIVNINDVAGITVGSTASHRTVTFKSGKAWSPVYATSGTIKYADTPKKVGAGDYFEHRLVSYFPGNDIANLSDFDNIGNQRFLVRMVFTNGVSYIFGDMLNPAGISKLFETEKGGNTITCYCDSVDKAFILT